MATIWEKFDKAIDTKALKEDVLAAQENKQEYRDVPKGHYEVKIEKLELVESKTSKPMVACWMKILSGEYKGQLIFYNQVIHVGFGIHKATEFLRSLDSGIEVTFDNYKQFYELLLNILEVIENKFEYEVDYGEDKKGYGTYVIKEVFEV
ncbi:Protein of unknown function (DUF669) [Desulfosporosinus acidiphilus SJ4]|uniref:DUF669 domain-containing protein n=1 Tax=Desulfosporosinus acidiphilus (strain DSM 22704 / JCM 16185 / SJ4) TaxID=646529 RepID=I4D3D3_DESAJ|nr:DUF669 domain-containing protein [Desulfosporosinus acidiphilus]AFM40307.1 Protein of unknown function (DUF669) [Desulfosporosinus acidiphilus SJ4]